MGRTGFGFANSKKLKKTYNLSRCLFFLGVDVSIFWWCRICGGASFHKNPMLKNDWCWREIPNLHRQTASWAASRSTADVGQKIAYPWSNAFVVHGSLGIKPLKHQGSLVWVGKISIGKRLVFMILGWSFGHDWYDWHDGVGTAKFFWRWNNTHIIWYVCIYLLVGFELMVASRFIWPTFFFQGLQLLREEATSTSSLSIDSRESHQGIPDSVSWYINDWKTCVALGDFFFKDGDMSWTAPEGSQTLGCLLPPTVPSDFSGSSSTCWIIMDHLPWKPGGVHPASQIIYLRKMAAVRLFIYIKQRWFYDSLETLLWWKGSMASRWMSESCAASTVIWVLRCFSLYFAVTSSCVNRRSLTTFSTSFGSTTTTTTITNTTQLPEVAASTKECLFLQTGVGYIFAQAAWHLKLSTWKRKHICITYQSLDFSCALSISKYSSEKTYDYHRCQQRTWIINDCSQTTSHPTVVASPSRRHLNDIKLVMPDFTLP